MSYNGIGLSTVRGSATSGHVQANRGHVGANRRRRVEERNTQNVSRERYNPVSSAARRQGNADIQKHEERRQIENQLLEIRDEMEDVGELTAQEIEERVDRERKRLLHRMESKAEAHQHGHRRQGNQQHHHHHTGGGRNDQKWDRRKTVENQAIKNQQDDRLGRALGIQKDAHVEGAAFDRELQEQKKAERQAKLDEERKKAEVEEKKQAKEEKKRAKEEKKEARRQKASSKGEEKRRRRYSSSSGSSSSGSSSDSESYSSSSESSRDRRKRNSKRRRSPSSSQSRGSR